jgi:hypothetical protein
MAQAIRKDLVTGKSGVARLVPSVVWRKETDLAALEP